jgi:GNAT superfamily N-acetyltransferase
MTVTKTGPAAAVRPMRPSDVQVVVRLCEELAAFERAEFCPDGKTEGLSRALFATVPQLWGFVVDVEGVVVGYATCTRDFSTWRAADYLHLDCLYLLPAHRRIGIGRQVMRAITRLAAVLRCATVEWQTPIWNEDATHFYERLGATFRIKARFNWREGDWKC